ncbi:MAG: S49 family peptidase, partial [Planctomycetota bacterium]|nr:S49 family peptidase [Planctomycetota bacterium]
NKPVVVSMGGVAASGGYYIAAPAEKIYAEPTTSTGSIGVVAVWPVLKGLMDAHGVEMVTIRSPQARRWKAAENFWESPEQRTRRNVAEMLDRLHEQFADVVREGRGDKLTTREIKYTTKGGDGEDVAFTEIEPLNGRVYLADEARQLGLIDEVGYLDDAAAAAAELASLTKPKTVRYVRAKTLREHMGFSSLPAGLDVKLFDRMMTPRIMMVWKAE